MKKMSRGKGKFILGALVGAGLGVLFAPKEGSKTRVELKKKLDELVEKAKEVDAEEVKKEVETRASAIMEELKDLDKEKAKKVAIEKGKDLEKKANELYKYAVKKGTPIVEKLADDVRLKTLDIVKDLETKLDKKTTTKEK